MKNKGFTLVELSVVLVVISLLVAGIMGAQSLLHAANLRSVITDVSAYKTAINTFLSQYEWYPGDIPIATTYWPAGSVYAGFTTGNGNGDGKVQGWQDEQLLVWNHLSASGLIPGAYPGTKTGNNDAGEEVPASKIEPGGYDLRRPDLFGMRRHYVVFASDHTTDSLDGGIVTGPDAQSIDEKIDDGLADQGDVMAYDGDHGMETGCLTNMTGGLDPPDSGDYKLDDPVKSCHMFFAIE